MCVGRGTAENRWPPGVSPLPWLYSSTPISPGESGSHPSEQSDPLFVHLFSGVKSLKWPGDRSVFRVDGTTLLDVCALLDALPPWAPGAWTCREIGWSRKKSHGALSTPTPLLLQFLVSGAPWATHNHTGLQSQPQVSYRMVPSLSLSPETPRRLPETLRSRAG